MRLHFSLDHFLQRIIVAGFVVALCLIPFAPFRVAGFFLAAGVLPGIAIASRSRFLTGETVGLGAAVSPVVFGCVVLLALSFGLTMGPAAWIGIVVALILFVFAWRGAPSHPGDSPGRRGIPGIAVLIAIAAVLSFALPLAKFWWRCRDDSWFHAAVTDKLLRDGLPLTDPYFAGLRLQYPYFYHSILGSCTSLAGIDPFHAMILVNGIALLSCAMAFYALSGLFSRRTGPRVLGSALWLFGMNGWFYLFYVVRIAKGLTGQTHGLAVLRELFPWTPIGHATAMSLITVEGNQFMFLDKFMLGTAFSLTFSLAASMLFLLLSARRGSWSVRHDALLFLATAGAVFLHPLAGFTLAVVTLTLLALLLLARSQTARGGPSYSRLVGWIVAGIAVALPYLHSVMPAGGGEEATVVFAFQPRFALGLLADILPALVLAAWFFRRAGDDKDTADRFGARPFSELTLSGSGLLGVWWIFALVVALFVNVAANNENKFAYFLWLPLCVFAVGCFEQQWDRLRARRTLITVVLSTALPLHMLYFHHAVRDKSTVEISGPEHAVYRWIEKSTPHDAVFIENNDIVRVPVLGHRDLYWGTEAYAHNWGYPRAEMLSRRTLRDHVFSAEGLGADDVMQLRVLGRRVFVIYRMAVEDGYEFAPERFEGSPLLRGRFATSELAVWEVILD